MLLSVVYISLISLKHLQAFVGKRFYCLYAVKRDGERWCRFAISFSDGISANTSDW